MTMTTMRIPAAFKAARERPFRSWLPAALLSVAPESESVEVCASPLRAACTLWPAAPRLRVISERTASRPCAEDLCGEGVAAAAPGSDEALGCATFAGGVLGFVVAEAGSKGVDGVFGVELLTEPAVICEV